MATDHRKAREAAEAARVESLKRLRQMTGAYVPDRVLEKSARESSTRAAERSSREEK